MMIVPDIAPAATAMMTLSTGAQDTSLAAGAVAITIGWAAHHKLAHRHKLLDLAAKAGIIGGSVLLVTGAGSLAGLLQSINGGTASMISGLLHMVDPTATWPHTLGLLSLAEIVILVWLGAHLYDLLRKKGAGRSPGSGTGATGYGTLARKQWDALEDKHLSRWGALAAGPLTVTLPGTLGAWCAVPFAALAGVVGHLIGTWLGV